MKVDLFSLKKKISHKWFQKPKLTSYIVVTWFKVLFFLHRMVSCQDSSAHTFLSCLVSWHGISNVEKRAHATLSKCRYFCFVILSCWGVCTQEYWRIISNSWNKPVKLAEKNSIPLSKRNCLTYALNFIRIMTKTFQDEKYFRFMMH